MHTSAILPIAGTVRTTCDLIYLADDEWGNDTMQAVAQEWFDQHPDCQFVQVYEHAGWSLTYARVGGGDGTSVEVVFSANDAAVFRPNRPKPTGYSGISHRRLTPAQACRQRILERFPHGIDSELLDRMVAAELAEAA